MKKNMFYIKSIALVFSLNAFIYFIIKIMESNFHVMGLPIDSKIPFLIGFIWIYMIWYPFEMFSLYIIYKFNKNKYIKVLTSICLALLVAYMCFIIYPTMVIRPEVSSYHDITSFIAYVAFKADTPAVNCFPSGHCILCFSIIYATLRDKLIPYKYRLLIIITNVLIVFSTLFTKQHVVIDVIGSFFITSSVYYLLTKTKYVKNIIDNVKKISQQ